MLIIYEILSLQNILARKTKRNPFPITLEKYPNYYVYTIGTDVFKIQTDKIDEYLYLQKRKMELMIKMADKSTSIYDEIQEFNNCTLKAIKCYYQRKGDDANA